MLSLTLQLPPALAVPDGLPDAESLLPDDIFRDVRFHGGDSGSCEIVESTDTESGKAFHIETRRKMSHHWDIGLRWTAQEKIERDDVLLLTFSARAIGKRAPGRAHLAFRRANKPYHHALGKDIRIPGKWKDFKIPFSPSVPMSAEGAYLLVNFGQKGQTLELADFRVLNFGDDISVWRLFRKLDIPLNRAGRKVVGEPLSPEILWRMAVWDGPPETPEGFNPTGSWQQEYLIFTCHGFMRRGNKRVGYLQLKRSAGDPFRLIAHRRLIVRNGQVNNISVEAECSRDAIAALQKWKLSSTFIHPDGAPSEELALQETARATDDGLRITSGESCTRTISAQRPITADWCLFDAVQRLPFDDTDRYHFDMMEAFSVVKRDYTLQYIGPQELQLGEKTLALHRFEAIGHGTLPWIFWLDDDHRLVLAITHSRAYILDSSAGDDIEERLQRQRARYERRKKRFEGDTR